MIRITPLSNTQIVLHTSVLQLHCTHNKIKQLAEFSLSCRNLQGAVQWFPPNNINNNRAEFPSAVLVAACVMLVWFMKFSQERPRSMDGCCVIKFQKYTKGEIEGKFFSSCRELQKKRILKILTQPWEVK